MIDKNADMFESYKKTLSSFARRGGYIQREYVREMVEWGWLAYGDEQ